MPGKRSNTIKDALGVIKAILYRTFVERNWRTSQPMFNVLQVEEGKENLFENFLRESLKVSLKFDAPISLGPYKDEASRTYIYVTHYASTRSFIKVMNGLLKPGISAMRAEATESTSWTYCNPTNSPDLGKLHKVVVAGINGDSSHFLNFLNQNGQHPEAIVEKIVDVRGKSLGTYILLRDNPKIDQVLEDFKEKGGDLILYRATKLPDPKQKQDE